MSAAKSIDIGDTIPPFSLEDQNGKIFDVEDYIGKKKLVIFFYPRDGSLNCTKQACYFRDIYDVFEEVGAEVIGISEQSVESHLHFSRTNNLNYRILSDPDNTVRNRFGVQSKLFGLIAGRVTFVSDISGKIVYKLDSQTNIQRHVDEALKICLVLKRANNGIEVDSGA